MLGQGSAELKSSSSVGQVALLMIVVPVYRSSGCRPSTASPHSNGHPVLRGLIGRFCSRYFALVNIGSLLRQLLFVSRIVKYAGPVATGVR
jgi:hypothetical protein